jgi:hypothetical protein
MKFKSKLVFFEQSFFYRIDSRLGWMPLWMRVLLLTLKKSSSDGSHFLILLFSSNKLSNSLPCQKRKNLPNTHTHTHIRLHTHSHTHTRTHTHTHAHIHTHTHTHAHIRIHARTHTYTRTHRNAHIQTLILVVRR